MTVGGTNGGDFAVSRMTITEPKAGTATMTDQGIAFDQWVGDDIQWPVGGDGCDRDLSLRVEWIRHSPVDGPGGHPPGPRVH